MSGTTLLVTAYALMWLILFVWMFRMWKRQGELQSRIEGLDKAIDRAMAKKSQTPFRDEAVATAERRP
jgi:CcmD family protein